MIFQIFVSHMLKSSSMALIEKSPGILCCSRNTSLVRHLSFEASVRIISNAAQYYFNSSSHFDDKFMQLAKYVIVIYVFIYARIIYTYIMMYFYVLHVSYSIYI